MWLEMKLYDDKPRSELEKENAYLRSIIEELQDKYNDETYYYGV